MWDTEDREWLLDDTMKLCGTNESGVRNAFGVLTEEEVSSIFFCGILSSGREHASFLYEPNAQLSFRIRYCKGTCLFQARQVIPQTIEYHPLLLHSRFVHLPPFFHRNVTLRSSHSKHDTRPTDALIDRLHMYSSQTIFKIPTRSSLAKLRHQMFELIASVN
jgi:hypothetical protein